MTKDQLKRLDADLWAAAHNLRQGSDPPRLVSGQLSVEDLAIQFPPSMAETADGGCNGNSRR